MQVLTRGCEPPVWGKGGRGAEDGVPEWWLLIDFHSHSNHRSIFHRFCSAPTCRGQTDRRNWLQNAALLSVASLQNSRTLHWNWPLVHTAKHCYRPP